MENLLRHSTFLVYFTVVIAMISAVILYIAATLLLGDIIITALSNGIWGWESARLTAVSLLKVWDLLLIAASFQIMSTGMYKLFLNPKCAQIGPSTVETFDDLKYVLVSLSIVVLVILFLERAIMMGPSRELLEFGVAVAVVIVAGGWTIRKQLPGEKGEL